MRIFGTNHPVRGGVEEGQLSEERFTNPDGVSIESQCDFLIIRRISRWFISYWSTPDWTSGLIVCPCVVGDQLARGKLKCNSQANCYEQKTVSHFSALNHSFCPRHVTYISLTCHRRPAARPPRPSTPRVLLPVCGFLSAPLVIMTTTTVMMETREDRQPGTSLCARQPIRTSMPWWLLGDISYSAAAETP